MDTEVIRQFLVSIGVQADEKGLKRFGKTVDDITKTTTEFAMATAAAAAAVSAAVVKISSQFEDLYYATQRLRSSADNIKAFSFGVSQMGGDAKAARESLESFASFIRSNPMGEGVVRGLGVETRTSTGAMREYADVLRDVGAQLRRMPYWAAKQRANMLGIDENTLQALLRGTDLWSERYRKLVRDSGVDMDQMAADATNLMQSFRLLRAEIEIYFYKALSKVNPEILRTAILIGGVAGAIALVSALLGPEIAAVVALGAAIALLADDFDGWRKGQDSLIDWTEWANDIDQVVGALKDVWGAFVEAGNAAWAFHDILTDKQWDQFGHGLVRILVDLLHMFADLTRAVADFMNMDFKKMGHDLAQLWRDGNDHPFADHSGDALGSSARARAAAVARGGIANDNTPAARGAASDAIAYFMRQGWTREQAAGIVANLNAESGLNPHGPPGDGGQARGIGQWHEDRQRDFARWAGHTLDQSTLAEQLAFVNYELTRGRYAGAGAALRKTRSARDAGAVVSSRYERPADVRGEMARRGAAATALLSSSALGGDGGSRTVTIHSKTEIKVDGAADAQATGKAVGDSVDQSNATLVRNTKAAVR